MVNNLSGNEPGSYGEYFANKAISNSRYGEMLNGGPSISLFGGLSESDFLPSFSNNVDQATKLMYEKAQKEIKKIKKKIVQIKKQKKSAKDDEKSAKEATLKMQERKLKTKRMRCKNLAGRLGVDYEEPEVKGEEKNKSSSNK